MILGLESPIAYLFTLLDDPLNLSAIAAIALGKVHKHSNAFNQFDFECQP